MIGLQNTELMAATKSNIAIHKVELIPYFWSISEQLTTTTFQSVSLAMVLLDLVFLSASTPTNSSAVSSGKTETRYSLVLAKFCMNSIKMTMHIEN